MNPLIQLKNATILPVLIALTLGCFGLSPQAQACEDGCSNFGTFQGDDALISNTIGSGNTAFGWRSLFTNTDGSFNTGVGGGALVLNNGTSNTAVGAAALLLNTSGTENTAVGTDALVFNDTGSQNTANGAFALFTNGTGSSNTANGFNALLNNTTGGINTAIGADALFGNTTGNDNIALGFNAGFMLTTGDNNIDIGNAGDASDSDTIRIGNSTHGRIFIPAINNIVLGAGVAVTIDSTTGLLGLQASSRRFKEEIKPMDQVSEALFDLKPVTFRYKKEIDPAGTSQLGLVAEEVEKVNPALVLRDKEGKPYSVRYDQVNAMLLNEFLKAHRKVQEQEATITELKKDFRATVAQLTARLDEQAAQIQKVSAQFEASKPAPQEVNNQ